MAAGPDLQLDILLYPDDGGFLAHCLQLDLVEPAAVRILTSCCQ